MPIHLAGRLLRAATSAEVFGRSPRAYFRCNVVIIAEEKEVWLVQCLLDVGIETDAWIVNRVSEAYGCLLA